MYNLRPPSRIWNRRKMSVLTRKWLGAVRRREFPLSTKGEGHSFGPATKTVGILSQAVNDRYRCREEQFDLVLNRPLSVDEGYFRFGSNAICYGRSCSGKRGPRPESARYDAMRDVAIENGTLSLPFDPTEIIDNFRLERYANTGSVESNFNRVFRRLYYHLRPFTNLAVRKQIQQFHARNWKRESFPTWPVDTTVEDICEKLLLLSMQAKGVDRVPFVWFWPGGARGCVTMTHDVETTAGRDFCADLMNVDDSFGFKATFGIVPRDRYEVSASLLELIRSRGFELAIQDLNHDGRLYDSKEEFLRRAKIINHYGREYGAKGFRAAVLYRKPEWYDALEFTFDMSFPNVAHLDPQRGGCCTVMPYFIGDILELPVTTIQDYTLFHVLNDRSIDLWKSQIELILRKNGLVSFIVHPDYLMEHETLSVYETLLAHLLELRGKTPIWCALPSEIDTWWRARNKMSVVKDGRSWRIEGDETGRAVLAYAMIVRGKLVYELASAARPQE
jgi:hypothetical protein